MSDEKNNSTPETLSLGADSAPGAEESQSDVDGATVEAGTVVVEVADNRPGPMEEPLAIPELDSVSTALPLLLEVGCEEIPARFLRDAERGLGERIQAALRQARLLEEAGLGVLVESPGAALHIEHSSLPGADLGVTTFSTPRRLVVHVPQVLAQQPDKVEEILGPPIKVALDANGNYTRAAESFAQKNSVPVGDLTRTVTPKGEYLCVNKTTAGRPATEVLAEILPGVILGLSFPKSMYWTAKSAPRFVRPIRWVVALLGEGEQARTLNFEILGVNAGNTTFGHRAKSRQPIAASDLKSYTNNLLQELVEIDYTKRKERIVEQARSAAESAGGKIVEDEWLVDWIANSTEWPRAMLGSFDSRFLHLPREILITVMRDHQRYFAVEQPGAVEHSGSGTKHGEPKLAPNFVAVLNMDSDEKGLIRQGHQRVLTARFRDAEFFWTTDQRVSLRERRQLLDKVTYQEKLGSYGAKINRMKRLASDVCAMLEGSGYLTNGQARSVLQAVELCKCDLTAQMVQEFTELQGIVGGLYAKAQGETEEVATAIYDQYLPMSAEGKSPRTIVAAITALVDKVDAVVGGFSVGLEPTGSRDPFALRRAGNGIVKILIENSLPIIMRQLVVNSLSTFGQYSEKIDQSVQAFLTERLKFYLETIAGCRHDTVRAVLAGGSRTATDALKRCQAVEKMRDSDDYVALAAAAKRTRNILRKSAADEDYSSEMLNVELFQEDAERELHRAYESSFTEAASKGVAADDYETALTLTAQLRQPIDHFFDKVLVMHQDPKIRKNRLLLLHLLDKQVFSRVADLSEIEGHVDASTTAS